MEVVSYSQIQPFASRAAKDHVSAKDSKNTLWFMYDNNRTEPCFCGLYDTGNGQRIKGVWVHPNRRKQGIGEQMTLALIDYATKQLNTARVEVFAYNSTFYESLGFVKFGYLNNGAAKLHKWLI